MGSLEEKIDSYFSSINPLARKIMLERSQVKNTYGKAWDNFSFEDQEKLIDQHFIGPEVEEKYQDYLSPSPVPQWFPKLKIDCGEKIIIDFDNEGWTWQDEHSGPFSWETKSMQNLSLLDIGAEEEGKKSKRSSGAISQSRENSTERDGNKDVPWKREKSIWQSPFLLSDRGLSVPMDSGYPSSQSSEHHEELDDVFQRFGITFQKGVQGNKYTSPVEELTSGEMLPRDAGIIDRPYEDYSSPGQSMGPGSRHSSFRGKSPSRQASVRSQQSSFTDKPPSRQSSVRSRSSNSDTRSPYHPTDTYTNTQQGSLRSTPERSFSRTSSQRSSRRTSPEPSFTRDSSTQGSMRNAIENIFVRSATNRVSARSFQDSTAVLVRSPSRHSSIRRTPERDMSGLRGSFHSPPQSLSRSSSRQGSLKGRSPSLSPSGRSSFRQVPSRTPSRQSSIRSRSRSSSMENDAYMETESSGRTENTAGVARTGFDFLDNW
ncbi:uncharacterized protein LOC106159827 [Lingula anatina]|uniref:Uncharacterized protein LOC106159827 n=1 Tax=Lingula anatina TaxID=7574 RepID=A0A1S3I096_LINAN|nr:uncharacterized protein LOC106159827 [Lingula anatina]|eukprot:XP_013391683.1 uncharacterized protein LOC106159827 [Lingula anatina]